MIEIVRTADSLSVKGHANYAEPGKDIVCAAVSALTQTLIQSIEELTDDTIQYDIQPGTVNIKFWCLSDLARGLVDAFFVGIRMIADEYPDNVKLTKH